MNLKGILVFSPQLLEQGTELLLELKLGTSHPILLKGFVHKISDESANKKGMVVAFLNPSKQTQKSIQEFIHKTKAAGGQTEDAPPPKPKAKPVKTKPVQPKPKTKTKPAKTKTPSVMEQPTEQIDDQPVLEPEKTMIVDDTLPALSLQSPDNSRELKVSTVDEELLHQEADGMDGKTKHVMLDDLRTQRKKTKKPFGLSVIYRALGLVILGALLILFFRHGVDFMEERFGIVLKPEPPTAPATTQTLPLPTVENPSTPTPSAPANGSLDTISIEDQGDFVKVTLLGQGDYKKYTSEKLLSPKRLQFTFSSLNKLTAKETMLIDNDPLQKITTKLSEKNEVIVTIFMTGDFAEFDASPFPHTLDLFFYR